MNYWFLINVATFLLAFSLFLFNLPQTNSLLIASILGLLGLFFILLNWNMHAMFSKIRKLKERKDRIRIAKYARKIMPYHMAIGLVGLLFISGHVIFIVNSYRVFINLKILSGMLALIALMMVSLSGYLRRIKATKLRRLFHLYSSFILFILIVIHVYVRF